MNARNVYGIVNTIMRQWAGWSGTVRDGEIFIRTKAQKRPQAGRSVRETGYMQQHVSGLITDCDRSPDLQIRSDTRRKRESTRMCAEVISLWLVTEWEAVI